MGDGARPQRDVQVDEHVGGAGGGELCCCHREYVGPGAEAVGKEEDVGVAAWSKGLLADGMDAGVVGPAP